MTRCNDFGDDGLYLGRRVAKVMWQDYDTRLSVLKVSINCLLVISDSKH